MAGGLTGAEERVWELLAIGCTNKQIARMLGISRRTAESHIAQIYGKVVHHQGNPRVVATNLYWGRAVPIRLDELIL